MASTVQLTSPAIIKSLQNHGLDQNNIRPAFPNFKEADTLIYFANRRSNAGDPIMIKNMNKAKIFTIDCPDTIVRNQLIKDLKKLPEVLFAVADGSGANDLAPNDGRYNEQWPLHNTVHIGADIHAEQAWDIYTGSANNIIGILDYTGIDPNHPDLQGKVLGDQTFTDTHGTSCASLAAANTNNGIGIAGVDWNADIYSGNLNGTDDNQLNDKIISAVNFSTNVRVLSNSWGLAFSDGTRGRYSPIVRQGFSVAYKANRVICASMGNYHDPLNPPDPPNYPAAFNTGIIAVGASDINDLPTNFTAQGDHVDVAAPGEDVLAASGNDYVKCFRYFFFNSNSSRDRFAAYWL